jgi:coniferyl-aldehyde dehydrogenase
MTGTLTAPSASSGIRALIEAQQAAFAQAPRRALAERRRDLAHVEALVLQNEDAIAEAIDADFGGRSRSETRLLEIAVTAQAARHARKNLSHWMKSRNVPTPSTAAPGRSLIRHEPKGVVGIVAPWNYPVQLSLVPLIAALAAGCRALLKPSELTPRTSELMARLLAERFPADQVAVVTGGSDVAEVFCSERFDHLFYTGSTRIGRSVGQAAARNLTPVTLELGGKSPVMVDALIPLDRVAHPLAWGRFLNAGQTCVAPDYALAQGNRAEALGQAVIRQAGVFYPDVASNPDYTAIVSDRHHARLTAMIDEARHRGVQVLQVPHDAASLAGSRRIAPTVMIDPPADLAVMREEIFGPVLPILNSPSMAAACAQVDAGERPLALYVFSDDRAVVRQVLDSTRSGGVSVNTTMIHLSNEHLPFGGVGESGSGAYHGQRGFEEFSHARSVFEAGRWHSSRLIAPPYGAVFRLVAAIALKS